MTSTTGCSAPPTLRRSCDDHCYSGRRRNQLESARRPIPGSHRRHPGHGRHHPRHWWTVRPHPGHAALHHPRRGHPSKQVHFRAPQHPGQLCSPHPLHHSACHPRPPDESPGGKPNWSGRRHCRHVGRRDLRGGAHRGAKPCDHRPGHDRSSPSHGGQPLADHHRRDHPRGIGSAGVGLYLLFHCHRGHVCHGRLYRWRRAW